jgi:hypothetical protein
VPSPPADDAAIAASLSDPTHCPGCRTPTNESDRIRGGEIVCTGCASWVLDTGTIWIPEADPKGKAIRVQHSSPLWSRMPVTASPDRKKTSPREYFITLDQAAALVNRRKRTLERYKNDKKRKMPKPRVPGGGGKPAEWAWNELKPWLEEHFNRQLPEIPPHHVGQ